ncbi:anoctamin family protein [Aspergillus tanneri]|uniref:Uncharacterized protein n=1 Tax=Aspergillus tanneri TaxID=1220188 RepID=A0A5M9MXZ2_9EURO|nr:uncharacterized protein ATNIH1004_002916 [Aspergillus tanneri]KAA8650234.1 hypothetical protein ATNIH1004_002916 [Aspergillus tanneri]
MAFFSAYGPPDQMENDNLGVDWVIHYNFEDLEIYQAVEEFRALINDLEEAHLQTQVRHGHGSSLLVCIRVPRDHLGKMIHQSRVKDWLYGIAHELPVGDDHTVADAETPAEELRSVYHAVTWQKSLGGAGITAQHGPWKHVSSAFPLHDPAANAELLRKWSRSILLTAEDLDAIRALFGEKVAFYYAFIHCYSSFLVFPAVWGVFCWLYLGPYSVTCAIVNCFWCIVFVEYWKIRETELSLRWNVKGVGALKVTRAQYVWDREIHDPITGETVRTFSAQKQLLRQMLLIPFATIASLALGTLIVATFGMEVFISEVYNGPFKSYLEFLPTVLFSLSLPSITNILTRMATRLTKYENYRTQDQYDIAQTSKTFVMHFITAFLPTILTAFVYVPFGACILPYLDVFHVRDDSNTINTAKVHIDPARLQQEVIYLSITAQVVNFGEEVVFPYVKRVLWQKWRDYREKRETANHTRRYSRQTDRLLADSPTEATFLARVRNEAEADEYDVQEDILEMCIQYGYLALFGVSWPLVPLGFLANNWLELRGDFFKLSLECQRPPPIRADSIGPSLQGMELLTWLGTLSTAAIVYLYRDGLEVVNTTCLLLSLLVAEWAYLVVRFAVRMGLKKLSIGMQRRESAKRYAVRKAYLDTFSMASSPRAKTRVRFLDRVSVYSTATDLQTGREEELQDDKSGSPVAQAFWSWPKLEETADAGVRLIKALSMEETKTVKVGKGA